jgi:hypothetical protein
MLIVTFSQVVGCILRLLLHLLFHFSICWGIPVSSLKHHHSWLVITYCEIYCLRIFNHDVFLIPWCWWGYILNCKFYLLWLYLLYYISFGKFSFCLLKLISLFSFLVFCFLFELIKSTNELIILSIMHGRFF